MQLPCPAAPESVEDAIRIQNEMRLRVRVEDDFHKPLRLIAGVDVGYDIEKNVSRAVVTLLDYKTLDLVASSIAFEPTPFPYVPGLLSFREAPAILAALRTLPHIPDMLMVDGHGIAHPRRLGIAAHMGVLTDLPAIGVAKKRLTGRNEEPGLTRGDRTDLIHKKEKIGTVLRSKNNIKPLFISPGHRVSHDTACAIVEHCLRGYKLPEPTRQADLLSKIKI